MPVSFNMFGFLTKTLWVSFNVGVTCIFATLPLNAAESKSSLITPEQMEWQTLPPKEMEWQTLPENKDLKYILLEGNPAEEGLYIIKATVPPGAMTRPHIHDKDRLVTVIEGTWYVGTQSHFDLEATTALPKGSFIKYPAGAVHYDGAKDIKVVLEIMGIGPVTTTYIK